MSSMTRRPTTPAERECSEQYFLIRRAYAEAIAAKMTVLKTIPLWYEKETNPLRAAMRKSISTDVRLFGDLVFPEHRQFEISVEAARVAATRGVDLWALQYDKQTKVDKGRRVFQYEHVVPVGSIVNAIHFECGTRVHEIEYELGTVRIAWILKSEDRELSRLGYRTERCNPDEAYALAGIEFAVRHQEAA